MTAIDLDAIRKEYALAEDHLDNHWSCCSGHRLGAKVPALLAELDRLRANQRDDLDALIEKQMRNPEFAEAFRAAERRRGGVERPGPRVHCSGAGCSHCNYGGI